ncbi:outer membrane protein assembly factor BamE [Asaia sp. HN010]|uniref:outer membrane protein assembly factor BamE domain-containing protein n=1 Tax=Asaia sp. HN010 TaxID=3081233 RepID=UPI00301AFB13
MTSDTYYAPYDQDPLSILLAALSLTSCASSGNASIKSATLASIEQNVRDGVTTKDQVRAVYGDPLQVSFTDSGHERWEYIYEKSHASVGNYIPVYNAFKYSHSGIARHLVIIFDKGTVWHHSFNESPVNRSSSFYR